MTRLSTIIGISVAICGLIGSIIAVDARYASSAEPEAKLEVPMGKLETIHSLQVALQRSRALELSFLFRNDDKNFKEIVKKNKELSNQIDKLIREAMETNQQLR